MRKGVAARPTATAGRGGAEAGDRAIGARLLRGLLALLFALQIAGWHAPARAGVAAPDAKASALARLEAAVHRTVTLCAHGTPSGRGDPADPGPCEHCVFCHAVGLAPEPAVPVIDARSARPAAIRPARADAAVVRPRDRGGATPRGPPTFG